MDDGMSALVMAATFASFGRKRRMQEDPEYAAKEEERSAKKAEAKYEADYKQGIEDNAEFDRNPRAFLRRLSKSKGGQS
jgi:hypothetical protein